jgi:hypothetical protein
MVVETRDGSIFLSRCIQEDVIIWALEAIAWTFSIFPMFQNGES